MLVKAILGPAHERLVVITDKATLIDAAKLLTSRTDLVIVCDDAGVLSGVVTKTDVVNQISACQGATCMCPAALVMTRDVALCRGADPLQDVSRLMTERHIKNMPVVDEYNRPVGVLTARAVLRALLSDAKYEEAQLFDYVRGIGYQ